MSVPTFVFMAVKPGRVFGSGDGEREGGGAELGGCRFDIACPVLAGKLDEPGRPLGVRPG
jgi:hypothetical protein